MSAHNSGSGPRSNAYSENRFTNWSEYQPWVVEIHAVFKRFDGKIAKRPAFPKIIDLPTATGFIRPCTAGEVEGQLCRCDPAHLKGLRAVFILSGTAKQLKSWGSGNAYYGHYWNRCVFLHAYPFGWARTEPLADFYIRNVLMHEIGHHVDLHKDRKTYEKREIFADEFARKYG